MREGWPVSAAIICIIMKENPKTLETMDPYDYVYNYRYI